MFNISQMWRNQNTPRIPIMDLSATTLSSFSSLTLLLLLRSSSAILPMVSLNWRSIRLPFVGRFCSVGNTGPRKKMRREKKSVLASSNESNTSTTEVFLFSNALKSWPNPPIPMESSLNPVRLRFLFCQSSRFVWLTRRDSSFWWRVSTVKHCYDVQVEIVIRTISEHQ